MGIGQICPYCGGSMSTNGRCYRCGNRMEEWSRAAGIPGTYAYERIKPEYREAERKRGQRK